MNDLSISIVIVTYNSAAVIGPCLNAIGKDLHPSVILVDNNSSDSTITIARIYGIKVLPLPRNIGFGQAANRGALASDAQFLCFLNPDCEPGENFFSHGVEAVQDFRLSCGVPKFTGGDSTPTRGRQPGYTVLKLLSDIILTNYGCALICRHISRFPGFHNTGWFWPHGACLFIHRKTFLGIHGFSPRYFMYMEDVVLGRNLVRSGGEILEFDAFLVHREGKGARISTQHRRRLLNRARCLYALDYHGAWLAILMGAMALPAELLQRLWERRQ
ncbi:MAG: glycosyltransferase [Pseudomonadota bacterium]